VIFLFLCLAVGSVQGFSFGGLSTWRAVVSLLYFSVLFAVSQGWINFFSIPDGLRHLFGDHNPSSIHICCVIFDLEGSNDAYPQNANLTLVGEIYFPWRYIFRSVLFGLVLFSFE
jgi:hypothetical protein